MGVPRGFGIVRAHDFQDLGKVAFGRLCALASEVAGADLVPVVATSYRELAWGLEEGELAVAWLPPVTTLDLTQRSVIAAPLAIPSRGGASTYHAALVVRRGGPRTIDDLRGRRAAWVDRDSASGYLIPRMHLASQGVDVLGFFAREIFMHSHAAVVDAIASGQADVGATYCDVGPSGEITRGAWLDESGRPIRPLETLTTFGPIPNDALVASNALPVAARAALTRWLFALDAPGKEAFERVLGTSDLRVPSPDHYKRLEHSLRAARARGHDSLPHESRKGLLY